LTFIQESKHHYISFNFGVLYCNSFLRNHFTKCNQTLKYKMTDITILFSKTMDQLQPNSKIQDGWHCRHQSWMKCNDDRSNKPILSRACTTCLTYNVPIYQRNSLVLLLICFVNVVFKGPSNKWSFVFAWFTE
jgi:hypothetical protein